MSLKTEPYPYPIAMASQTKEALEVFLNQPSVEIAQQNPLSVIKNNLYTVHEKMKLRKIVWMNNASLGTYGSFGIQSNQKNLAGLPTIMLNLMKNTTMYLLHNCDLSFDFTYSPGKNPDNFRESYPIYYDDEAMQTAIVQNQMLIQVFDAADEPPALPDSQVEIHENNCCVLV